jgi:hypothetical protein
MNYIITTQITSNYYQKSKILFDSVNKYWKGRFVVGFIDFAPTDYNGEYYLMKREDIYTYSKVYPKNRTDFVCPQGGEFIDFLNCSDDDIIIQIDADTIMQREMTNEELLNIIPDDNEIISVYCANPPMSLYQITKNLKFKNPEDFKYLKNYNEFTGSILIANKKTFTILRDNIISEWNDMIKVNSHHAGIQWLISKVTHEKLKIKIIDSIYQCGIWYFTFNTKIYDYKLYLDDKIVVFNHTQFNDSMYIRPNSDITPTWTINLSSIT